MRAVVHDVPGNEYVLRIGDVSQPELGPGEVRIRVAAAGVNRADLLQRRGLYPPPEGASEILGLECSGTVLEVGEDVNHFVPGDRVMALLTGGGYAEEVVVPARCTMKTPSGLTNIEAGGVPEVFLTAFLNLFLIAELQPGETALIQGGSGGVGTAAIQLVTAAGARAVVTAGSEDRCQRCLDLGAIAAIDYHQDDFVEQTLDVTKGRGADVVLDCIGANYLSRHLQALAVGGRMVVIGLQGGATEEIDLSYLMRRRISLTGSTLRARPTEEKGLIIDSFLDRFGSDLETGALSPIIDRFLPFDQASEAHRLLASGEIFGKVILSP